MATEVSANTPVAVVPRAVAMGGAAVPETPVDEHRDAEAREQDICPSPEAWQGGTVDVVPEPHPVQDAPERDLVGGIAAPYPGHPSAHPNRRWRQGWVAGEGHRARV